MSNVKSKLTSEGGSLKFIDKFETKYVDVYRILIVLVVFLTLSAAILASLYWFGVVASSEEHRSEDYFKKPSWSSIRLDVLPIVEETNSSAKRPNKDAEKNTGTAQNKEEEIYIDPRIVRIADNLARQFERNEGGVKQFQTMLPKRVLQDWLLNNSGVAYSWRDRFLSDIEAFSNEIGDDARINRIGSIDERAKMLISAMEAFLERYLESIGIAGSAARQMNEEESERRDEANTTLLYLLPICAYILLSLIALVVLIRVEVHLRTLAKNSSTD